MDKKEIKTKMPSEVRAILPAFPAKTDKHYFTGAQI